MMENTDLLPCPLCGGEARVHIATDTPRVYCTVCRCNTGGYKTEEAAVSAWNKRAETVIESPKELGEGLESDD
ncbi:MAG: hypothetical protein HFK04_03375 [Oscillospiraceae bacterium]|nr:hypothetical protein [Oscillospiraceae bacterium]